MSIKHDCNAFQQQLLQLTEDTNWRGKEEACNGCAECLGSIRLLKQLYASANTEHRIGSDRLAQLQTTAATRRPHHARGLRIALATALVVVCIAVLFILQPDGEKQLMVEPEQADSDSRVELATLVSRPTYKAKLALLQRRGNPEDLFEAFEPSPRKSDRIAYLRRRMTNLRRKLKNQRERSQLL